MVLCMIDNETHNKNIKYDLVKAMLPHVPFDGWTWTAVENGSVDIGFKKKETPDSRLLTYQNLFADGSIDFIDCFSDFIDVEVKNKYEALVSKPERIPQKIKTIILIRLELCQIYKEAIRCSLSITALPNNSKKSLNILYRTCNSIWRIAGDKSTDFSFYTKRATLAAIYTSTLLFWLNESSINQEETSAFLDRRLNDINKISSLKKPFSVLKKISKNINKTNNKIKMKPVFDFLKKLNQMRNSSFS